MLNIEHIIKQKSYEKPVHLMRRHPIIFLKTIIIFALLFALPYTIYLLIAQTYPTLALNHFFQPIALLFGSAYYLAIWLFLLSHFIDYYLDLWIVTNERIVNIEQEGLFSRTVAELDLYKVQDVTSEIHGMFPTFFNYGNVHIQTAAEKGRFVFEQISNPHEVRKSIIDLVEADRKYHLKDVKVADAGI